MKFWRLRKYTTAFRFSTKPSIAYSLVLCNVSLRSDSVLLTFRFFFLFFFLSQTIAKGKLLFTVLPFRCSTFPNLIRKMWIKIRAMFFFFHELYLTKNGLPRNPVRWQKCRNLLFFHSAFLSEQHFSFFP